MDPQTCDIELEGHDDEVEALAEEEEEGVAVVLVLQVVPERPELGVDSIEIAWLENHLRPRHALTTHF